MRGGPWRGRKWRRATTGRHGGVALGRHSRDLSALVVAVGLAGCAWDSMEDSDGDDEAPASDREEADAQDPD